MRPCKDHRFAPRQPVNEKCNERTDRGSKQQQDERLCGHRHALARGPGENGSVGHARPGIVTRVRGTRGKPGLALGFGSCKACVS